MSRGNYFLAFHCFILNYTSIGVEFHVIEVNPKHIMAPAQVQHIFYVKQFKYTNTNVQIHKYKCQEIKNSKVAIEVNPGQIMGPAHVQHDFYLLFRSRGALQQ